MATATKWIELINSLIEKECTGTNSLDIAGDSKINSTFWHAQYKSSIRKTYKTHSKQQ